jgi:3-dehydroquinate synthase
MQIDIHSKIKDYSLIFSENFCFFDELFSCNSNCKVIIDRNVLSCYREILAKYLNVDEIIEFDAVEQNKNMDMVLRLCDMLMSCSAKKNMTVISFGGGITQDVTGFLALILYRGVNWVYIPTTLLSQADSCLGSKTSLNHGYFKNLLGSFYPPSKIYIDAGFTKTLSQMDFYSGFGEIVKLHLMGGSRNIAAIMNVVDTIEHERNNIELLTQLVQNSLQIKYSYIKNDEFDLGKRNLLNYGHCFGHALEASSEYAIPHGIAVAIGIIFANQIAVKRGLLAKETAQCWYDNLLKKCIRCNLKAEYFDKAQILLAMKMDKKRTGEGLPVVIMADNTFELRKLTDIAPSELFDVIDEMLTLLDIQS